MDLPSGDYKNAQRNFYKWTSLWANSDHVEEAMVPDVIDIVSLLQAVGFKVRFFDKSEPSDVARLRDGSKGVRITVNCVSSGVRSVLEYTGECRCPDFSEAKLWEVSGSQPKNISNESMETGSDMLVPVSQGTRLVVTQVLSRLMRTLMKGTVDRNDNKTPRANLAKTTPRSVHSLSKRISAAAATATPARVVDVNPSVKVCSPELPMSPTRYRSLDTLAGNVKAHALPEPGKLKKSPTSRESQPPNMSYSSPDLTCVQSHDVSTLAGDNYVPQSIYEQVQRSHQLISNVALYFRNNPNLMTGGNSSKLKDSKESLVSKKLFSFKPKADVKGSMLPQRSLSSSNPHLAKSALPKSKPGTITGRPSFRGSGNAVLGVTFQKTASTVKDNGKQVDSSSLKTNLKKYTPGFGAKRNRFTSKSTSHL